MYRFLPFVLAALFLLPAAGRAAAGADAITGLWLDAKQEGYVQIHATPNGHYAGRIVGATDGDVRDDTQNPDPAKRDRSLLGQRILRGFTYDADDRRWEGGRIYDPDKGKTYDAWLKLTDNGKLKVHGYIGISLIGRTQLWTRAERDDYGVKPKALVETE